jgi:hypothetical protein
VFDQAYSVFQEGLMKLKEAVTKVIRFLTGAGPDPPRDPYASVREPVKRGPGGQSAAVAVPEPETDEQN